MNRDRNDFDLGRMYERAQIARESPLLTTFALGLVVGFLTHWALF